MIAIIDYGAGNLFSVQNALTYLNETFCITRDPAMLEGCDGMILPGVGAFPDAMKRLRASGLVPVIQAEAQKKPLLGICLGMQMLFERSFEFGETEGLGLIPGSVRLLDAGGLKIPHMGWNSLDFPREGRLFKGLGEHPYVYFVHSYYLKAAEEEIVTATADYTTTIHASVEKDNVFACQFHPEKSSDVGLQILKNFVEL